MVAEIVADGGSASLALGDLATDNGAAAVIADVRAAVDGIDILVNNIGGNEAAGGGLTGWFNDTPQVWTGTMQQNLVAPVRMIHAFVPAMRERGWGRVINISGGGGSARPPQAAAYCAAKAAVNNLTVSLSLELARSGVTVNTVSPGCTRTEMFEGTLRRMGEAQGWPDDMGVRARSSWTWGSSPARPSVTAGRKTSARSSPCWPAPSPPSSTAPITGSMAARCNRSTEDRSMLRLPLLEYQTRLRSAPRRR